MRPPVVPRASEHRSGGVRWDRAEAAESGATDLHDHVRYATDHRLRTDGGSALSPRVVDAPEDRAPAVVVAAAAHSFSASDQVHGCHRAVSTVIRAQVKQLNATRWPYRFVALLLFGELRDSGLLTDEEFAAQKAKLLGT